VQVWGEVWGVALLAIIVCMLADNLHVLTAGVTVRQVLSDWDNGIEVKSEHMAQEQLPAVVAPMRCLEFAHETVKKMWRYGAVSKAVTQWKYIVYAVHTRVYSLPRFKGDATAHAAMSLDAAVEDLERVLSDLGTAGRTDKSNSQKANKPTLSKLATHLGGVGAAGLPRSWKPQEYEDMLHTAPSQEGLYATLRMSSSAWGC
jgi:hypothetical protein